MSRAALASVSTPAPRDLLSPAEAARRLGVARRFVVDAARRGALACYVFKRGKDGRATVIAFSPDDLAAFVAAHRREARA